jgi:hypothetical protein
MPDNALCGRIKRNIPPLLMLNESHPRRNQGNKARILKSSSSFHPS